MSHIKSTRPLPVLEFLAPRILQRPTPKPARLGRRAVVASSRPFSTTLSPRQQTDDLQGPSRTPKFGPEASASTAPVNKPLTQAQRDFLASALRVNQAGELAATLIYTAQTPPLVASHPQLRPLMKHMYDQEAGHFKTFNEMLARHRVRPTAMYPVWQLAATALGWGTAVMGREAAMACTEAVETEIGGHYNGQIRVLLDIVDQMKARGEEIGEELSELITTLRRIRDEELEHLDHAVENDAQKAVPHSILTGVIRAGCRGAIWISERV